jgi:hypothetical protein
MSALRSKADILGRGFYVCEVPIADLLSFDVGQLIGTTLNGFGRYVSTHKGPLPGHQAKGALKDRSECDDRYRHYPTSVSFPACTARPFNVPGGRAVV